MALDVPLDNPAGRLYWIFEGLSGAAPNHPIETALKATFKLSEPLDLLELFRNIAATADLRRQAEEQVLAIDDANHSLFLRWTKAVDSALLWMGRLPDAASNLQGLVSETDRFALATCADLLHRRMPEPVIDEQSVPELVELVRNAIDAIAGDESLPPAARSVLIARLREVENALIYIRITGFAGVEEAMDALTGTMIRESVTSNTNACGWLAKLWTRILGAVAGATQIAGGVESTMAAIEAVKKFGE